MTIGYYPRRDLLRCTIGPEEVTAHGAAAQAARLAVRPKQPMWSHGGFDVAPLSLGVETAGGAMTTLIPRNTVVPARRTLCAVLGAHLPLGNVFRHSRVIT